MRPLPLALFTFLVLSDPALADEPVVPPAASCPGLPPYPASERASGVSGKVVIKVVIDATGAASEVTVAAGLGPAFDQLALEAAKKCTFTAATVGDKPVPAAIELSVDFVAPPAPARLEGQVVGELGEPLAGASVTAGSSSTLTDVAGRFTLDFDPPPDGELWVMVARPEYSEVAVIERLLPGETRHGRYQLVKKKIAETQIHGNRMLPPPPKVDRTPQVSHFQITRADIDRTPGALEDISRVVQDMPGVVADPDLMATFFVRGGGPEEVGYYLDGVPLANPFHLGGFASIYNPMLIESADFFAGGVPARYEPALSGVLDVGYATGETTRPKVQADVSMNTAKARIDTPTGIEGLSVLVSARRSYFELYFAGLREVGNQLKLSLIGEGYVAPDITEYTARVNYRRGKHQLTATFLRASDGLSFIVNPGEQVLVN
ncbi:MAG: TonB family protein, partial [Myxococcaceae bacterium]